VAWNHSTQVETAMKEPRPTRPLPPGQQLAAPGKWPLVGERVPAASGQPALQADGWLLRIGGLVEQPRIWSLSELSDYPVIERSIDVHCVTRWSMLGTAWRGVPLRELLAAAVPTAAARFLSFVSRSPRRHSTSLPLADIEALDPLVAWQWQGVPIPEPHGGPLRLIVPERYFYKSLKWLDTIELLAEDRLGYWEREAGYHNRADPWREERFVAAGVTRAEAARILRDRDLSDLNVLGLDGSGRELAGLRAERAILRAADFARSQLDGAAFRHANLSGASFRNARLAGADFSHADVEGVDFRGADLRGADFRGASLFGVWLVDESVAQREPNGGPPAESPVGEPGRDSPVAEPSRDSPVAEPARVDSGTRFDPAVWEQLSPAQAAFLARSLGVPLPQ
jgi:DMSO/TMAO reductase YedYZ molybdopterin-dependent catalytic subunit